MFGNSWQDRVDGFLEKPEANQKRRPPGAARFRGRRIVHIDMDAYFAALEEIKNPHLAGKPIAVGSSPTSRGVVSTASYPARRYGVRSGMSTREALRLCPQVIFVGSELQQYTYVSAELINIYHKFSPSVQATSVDEAFLDITGCAHLYGSEEQLGRQLKNTIRDKLSLTCSVGIASTKVMAKVASSVFKPDGLTVLDQQGIIQIVHPLPVGKLWGVGPSTLRALEEIGIKTIGDLAHWPVDKLRRRLGSFGEALRLIARGEDDSRVLAQEEPPQDKSMSHERTLPLKAVSRDYQLATLHYLCDRVTRRMRRHNYEGRTVTLKLRWTDFKTITRAITFSQYTDDTLHIYKIVKGIWQAAVGESNKPVRLLGVAVSHLREKVNNPQLGLFDNSAGRRHKITDTFIDSLRDKYGESVIHRAYSHLGSD